MHNKFIYIIFVIVLVYVTQSVSYAQQPNDRIDPKDNWIRVQSDNGEFSIEVPAKYKFYRNQDGFFDSKDSTSFHLKNMNMLNAYESGTLLSLETYEAGRGALSAIYEGDLSNNKDAKKTELKRNEYKLKQLVSNSEKSYVIRQYFNSKKYIYVLTAASRTGETEQMRRFFDSLIFRTDTTAGMAAANWTKLRDLPITETQVEMKLDSDDVKSAGNKPVDKPKDDSILALTILSKPRAAYVEAARQKRVVGTVRVRLTFAEDGFVSNIVVLKTLPEGLLRQALFAAIRMKFLPKTKIGIPESSKNVVEYTFSIY